MIAPNWTHKCAVAYDTVYTPRGVSCAWCHATEPAAQQDKLGTGDHGLTGGSVVAAAPTPETDGLISSIASIEDRYHPLRELSKSLERERDALAAHAIAIEESVNRLKAKASTEHNDQPFCPYCNPCRHAETLTKLERERNEALSRWEQVSEKLSVADAKLWEYKKIASYVEDQYETCKTELAAITKECDYLRAKLAELLEASTDIDWGQVLRNGGPPCFHIDSGRFCLRAKRWNGHDVIHPYTTLHDASDKARGAK